MDENLNISTDITHCYNTIRLASITGKAQSIKYNIDQTSMFMLKIQGINSQGANQNISITDPKTQNAYYKHCHYFLNDTTKSLKLKVTIACVA